MLVSGWGYTAEAHAGAGHRRTVHSVPYRRPQRLADNDAVFAHPSTASIVRLRKHHELVS